MKVTIKLAGPIAEAAGTPRISADFPGKTMGDLLTWLCGTRPELKVHLFSSSGISGDIMIIHNDRPVLAADLEEIELTDGDTLAIMYPVSGG